MDSEAQVKSGFVNGSWWRKRTLHKTMIETCEQWAETVIETSWKQFFFFFFQRQNMNDRQCNHKILKDFKVQKSHKNVTGQMSEKICFLGSSKPHGIYRCSRLQRHQIVEQPVLKSATLQEKKIWCYWRAGISFWRTWATPELLGFL